MHGLWHVFDYTEEQNGKTEKVKALGLEQIQAQLPETASPLAASLSHPRCVSITSCAPQSVGMDKGANAY